MYSNQYTLFVCFAVCFIAVVANSQLHQKQNEHMQFSIYRYPFFESNENIIQPYDDYTVEIVVYDYMLDDYCPYSDFHYYAEYDYSHMDYSGYYSDIPKFVPEFCEDYYAYQYDYAQPDAAGITKKYLGEGESVCEGTYANISFMIAEPELKKEEVARVASAAIAKVTRDPSIEVIAQQSTILTQSLMQAIAQTSGHINLTANSPNPGCWAIAKGQTQPNAFADFVMLVLQDVFIEAAATSVQRDHIYVAQNFITKEVYELPPTIDVFVGTGSGHGMQTSSSAQVLGTGSSIQCSFARILSALAQLDVAEVLTTLKCDHISSNSPVDPYVFSVDVTQSEFTPFLSCKCQQTENNGAPAHCGQWGSQQNKDFICYVENGEDCPCAEQSQKFPGLSWRYCGPSLESLVSVMKFYEATGNGYCPMQTYQEEKVVAPELNECPLFTCIGSAKRCCEAQEPDSEQLCDSMTGVMKYVSSCGEGARDVWEEQGGFQCVCDA
eukprot:TRINITY_DN2805_c0_g1_i1.p1 TRINITY_DN2805_c0_g1~~TRINITY_DN2805_c0_g1_i1.p1  ORF type:complete len:515 (+),score=33.15 TRINITY_DN2805_c0_g1_i1:63-1547(+)